MINKKEMLISIGNKLLEIYRYDSAFACFEKAGSKHLIIEFGNKCLLEGDEKTALRAYGFSDSIVPNELMVKCGDYHARRKPSLYANKAIDAYHYAGNKEKLVNFAKKMLKKGELDYAKRAYRIVGKEVSQKELFMVASVWLEYGYEEKALELYSQLNIFPDLNILVRSGTKKFKAGDLETGLLLFRKAKVVPPKQLIVVCGDKNFTKGNLKEGLKAYRIAKKKPSKKILIACAKSALRKNDHNSEYLLKDAIEACLFVGMRKPVIALGEKYFREGNVKFGEICFNALKMSVPPDVLISCADHLSKKSRDNYNDAANMYGKAVKSLIRNDSKISKMIMSEKYRPNTGFSG